MVKRRGGARAGRGIVVAVGDSDRETPWYALPFRAIHDVIPERYPLLRLAVPTQLASLTLAYFLVTYLKVRPMPITCEMPFWRALGMAAGLEAVCMALFFGVRKMLDEIQLPEYMKRLIAVLPKAHPAELVAVCAMVGFTEEVLARGVLLPLLGWAPSLAIFVAVHRPKMGAHALMVGTTGAVFTLELLLTRGLLVPILHHFFRDLFALGLLYVVLRKDPEAGVEGL